MTVLVPMEPRTESISREEAGRHGHRTGRRRRQGAGFALTANTGFVAGAIVRPNWAVV